MYGFLYKNLTIDAFLSIIVLCLYLLVSMVEVGYRWSTQQKMSKAQIQQLIKDMNNSTKWLPIIEEEAEKSSKKEEKTAEQQLDKFLNS